MAKEIIAITDLVDDHMNPVIENQTFENKDIRGPALLAPLDDNVKFDRCNIAGSEEQIFIDLPVELTPIGVIGIKSVAFVGCDISGIGVVRTLK